MDKHKAYILTLSILIFSSVVALSAVNESRLDAYISLITVSYLAASSIFRPRRRAPDILGLALILIFAYIVAVRIIEILT